MERLPFDPPATDAKQIDDPNQPLDRLRERRRLSAPFPRGSDDAPTVAASITLSPAANVPQLVDGRNGKDAADPNHNQGTTDQQVKQQQRVLEQQVLGQQQVPAVQPRGQPADDID